MYSGTSIVDTALAAWRFPSWTSGSLLLTLTLYARGFAALHRQMPSRFPVERLGFFLAGTAAIALALISPLEALDDTLLTTHMVQHLLLLTIAPPLLLLGAPQIPLIRGIPPRLAKRTIAVIAKSHSCRRFFRLVTHPVSAFLLFSIAMLGWHLPRPFETALRSDYWHALEHGCFLLAGMIFWYPILRPWPAVEQWTRWAFVPYLMIADAENSVLAAFMVFSGRVIYPSYANAARISGIPALTDQLVAGAIMWLPGSMPFLIPAVVIVIRALQSQTLATPRSGHYVQGVGTA